MASIKVEAATADSFASRDRHDNALLFCKCSHYMFSTANKAQGRHEGNATKPTRSLW